MDSKKEKRSSVGGPNSALSQLPRIHSHRTNRFITKPTNPQTIHPKIMSSSDTAPLAAAAAAVAVTASEKAHSKLENKEQEKPNPIQSFFVNILQHLPLPKNEPKTKPAEPAKPVIKEKIEESKPVVVTFPKHEKELPSLKFEAEGGDTNTNPFLLWQVYAIGGFFVMRWAWSRWNERKGKKKPSNEEHATEEPPNEDPPPSHS